MDNNKQILELMTEMNTGIREELKNVRIEMQEGFKSIYSTMQEEFNHIYAEFKDIQMTLENETNKNIQLIAEGHFNLNRKLDDALKVENEKGWRLNPLTNES